MISGANVMIPGMLSEGGKLPQGKIPHNIVAVYVESLDNAISIGQMTMSAEDMKEAKKANDSKTMEELIKDETIKEKESDIEEDRKEQGKKYSKKPKKETKKVDKKEEAVEETAEEATEEVVAEAEEK